MQHSGAADLDPLMGPAPGHWVDPDDPGGPSRRNVWRAVRCLPPMAGRRAGADFNEQQRIHIAQREPSHTRAGGPDPVNETRIAQRCRRVRVRRGGAACTGCPGRVRVRVPPHRQTHRDQHRQQQRDNRGPASPRAFFGPSMAAQHFSVDAPIARLVGRPALSRHHGVTSWKLARGPETYSFGSQPRDRLPCLHDQREPDFNTAWAGVSRKSGFTTQVVRGVAQSVTSQGFPDARRPLPS